MWKFIGKRSWGQSVLFKRMAAGAGAYGYAQMVTILTQILSLPLFLTIWDLETYGHWIVMSSIPFYLSLSDAGISTASGNQMIRLVAQRQMAAANEVFQSALMFLTAIFVLFMGVIAIVVFFIPEGFLDIPRWKLVILMLSVSVFLGLFCSLGETIYKASSGYAAGTYLITTGRLVEWSGGIAGLLMFRTYLGVAGGALFARSCYFMLFLAISNRRMKEISWGFRQGKLRVVKQSAVPGLSFFGISLTNALGLQGFTLLTASMLGPVAVAIFNTYRTIARIIFQLTGALSNPLWPELSRLHGAGNLQAFKKLYGKASWLGVGIAFAAAGLTFIVAPYVLATWSKGKIPYDALLMMLFLGYSATASAWQVPRVVLMAINAHLRLSWVGALATVASLGLAALLSSWLGVRGVVMAMIAAELCMWAFCTLEVRKLPALKESM